MRPVQVKSRQPFAERDYYSDPRRRAKSGAVRLASRVLRPLGFDLELRHFYSPIPQTEGLPATFWTTPSAMADISPFDTSGHLDFLEHELSDAIAEFRPARKWSGASNKFYMDNGLYQGADAVVLYSIVRRFRPRRVLELGAGFSTLVTAMAVQRNGAEGHACRFVAHDPFALAPAPGEIPGLTELRAVAAEAVPLSEFESLGANDVLFIDSSHTVKVGGDVCHLLLDVLPRLAPGVLVHLHDIFLPWHYPRDWIEHNRWYWAEQYLLQAMLVGNPRLEVLFAAYAVSREQGARLAALVPDHRPAIPPLSFWIRVGAR